MRSVPFFEMCTFPLFMSVSDLLQASLRRSKRKKIQKKKEEEQKISLCASIVAHTMWSAYVPTLLYRCWREFFEL